MSTSAELKNAKRKRVHRSAITGRFVSSKTAKTAPRTQVKEASSPSLVGSDGLTDVERKQLAQEARTAFNIMPADDFKKAIQKLKATK